MILTPAKNTFSNTQWTVLCTTKKKKKKKTNSCWCGYCGWTTLYTVEYDDGLYTLYTLWVENEVLDKNLCMKTKKKILFFFFYYDLWSFTDTGQKKKKPESWTSSQRQLWQDDTGGQRQNHGHRHNMMLYGHTVIIFIIFIIIIGNNHKCHPVTSEPAWYYLNFISSDWYCSLSLKVHRWSISEPANPRLPFCW